MKKRFLALAVAVAVAATSAVSALEINGNYIGDIEVGAEFGFPLEKFYGKDNNPNMVPNDKDFFQLGAGFNVNYFYNRIGLTMDFDWGFSAAHPKAPEGTDLKQNFNTFYFKLAPALKIIDTERIVLKANTGILFGSMWMTEKQTKPISSKIKSSMPFVFGLGLGAEFNFNFTDMFYAFAATDFNYVFAGKSKAKYTVEGVTVESKADKRTVSGAICFMPKIGFGVRF